MTKLLDNKWDPFVFILDHQKSIKNIREKAQKAKEASDLVVENLEAEIDRARSFIQQNELDWGQGERLKEKKP